MPKTTTTLREFLEGEPLTYDGFSAKKLIATYRAGVGVYVESRRGEALGVAEVLDDESARRLYSNLTRARQP